jgi:hypothetical protein
MTTNEYAMSLIAGILTSILIVFLLIPIAVALALCPKFTLDKLRKIYYILFTRSLK